MATLNGTVKRLVSDKGFGFILAGDGTETSFTIRPVRRSPSTSFTRDRRSPSSADQGTQGGSPPGCRVKASYRTEPPGVEQTHPGPRREAHVGP